MSSVRPAIAVAFVAFASLASTITILTLWH